MKFLFIRLLLTVSALTCTQVDAGKLEYPEQGFYVDLPTEIEWFEIISEKIDKDTTPLFITDKERKLSLMISYRHMPGGGTVKDHDIREGFESDLPEFKLSYSTFLGRESAVYEFPKKTPSGVTMHNRTRLVLFGEEAFVFSIISNDEDYLAKWSLTDFVKKKVDQGAGINSVTSLRDSTP